MGIYEATITMTFADETFINRFNYRTLAQPSPLATSADLAAGLGAGTEDPGDPTLFGPGTVLRGIQALATTELKFISINVFNLYEPSDFAIVNLQPKAGNIAPPSEPPFVAIGFRGLRTSRDVRNAQKRFPGVPRSYSDGSGFLNAGALVVTTDVENILISNVVGPQASYQFVVLSKRKEDVVENGVEKRKYLNWETEAEALANSYPVSEWQVFGRLRTQTSRQYFRGD